MNLQTIKCCHCSKELKIGDEYFTKDYKGGSILGFMIFCSYSCLEADGPLVSDRSLPYIETDSKYEQKRLKEYREKLTNSSINMEIE